jgi:hypothetical protein
MFYRLVTLLSFAVLGTVAVASAQLRYVDNEGIVHWVQTPEQIPPEYRENATRPRLPEIDAAKGEDRAVRTRRKSVEADNARERERRASTYWIIGNNGRRYAGPFRSGAECAAATVHGHALPNWRLEEAKLEGVTTIRCANENGD